MEIILLCPLDTVSLSAKGQPDTDTGTQGMRDDEKTKPIWEPAEQFLHEAKARKARAVDRELRGSQWQTRA